MSKLTESQLKDLILEIEEDLKKAIKESSEYTKKRLDEGGYHPLDTARFDQKSNWLNGKIQGITDILNFLEKKKNKSLSFKIEEPNNEGLQSLFG